MGVTSNIKNIVGVVTVQIEGFFTERFINLCKINNIKIWDIKNIVKGVVRFNIRISDFKKLRKIAKKTKCKVSIKNKKGIYFKIFKYRKRKVLIILLFLGLLFSISFSTFIWNIEVIGNEKIPKEEIISSLKNGGMYVGKTKIGLDKKEVINNLRKRETDLSWVGIEIDGTKAIVKVVEKTRIEEKNVQNLAIGDIVATKPGVITKIIAENGTAKHKVYDYINPGDILIEGSMYSKTLQKLSDVPAKGYVRVNNIVTFEKEYKYSEIKKKYTSKKRTTIGITVNSKENMLNYLNKAQKYDITKKSKSIKIFDNEISFDLYDCKEYNEIEKENTKDELLQRAEEDSKEYLDTEVLNNCIEPTVVDFTRNVVDIDGGIKVKFEYVINEQEGKFVERGT